MKLISQITFLVLIALWAVGCSSDDGNAPEESESAGNVITEKNTTRINALLQNGNESGITTYAENNTVLSKKIPSFSRAANQNEKLFISQYPLIEKVYEIDIELDSVITLQVDTVLMDTISVLTDLIEVKRDTTKISINNFVYRPNGERVIQDFYIGNGIENDSIGLYIKWEFLGEHINDFAVEGFEREFVSVNSTPEQFEPVSEFGDNDNQVFVKDLYLEEAEIPIFDDEGNQINTEDGLRFKIMFYTEDIDEYEFRMTVYQFYKPGYGEFKDYTDWQSPEWVYYRDRLDSLAITKVSQDFKMNFVTENTYHDRQCWLRGDIGCKDKFEN